MGLIDLKNADRLHSISDKVEKIEIVLRGKIRLYNSVISIELGTGTILGLNEPAGSEYEYNYEAVGEAAVYSYDYTGEESIADTVRINDKIMSLLASASFKFANRAFESYISAYDSAVDEFHKIKEDYQAYQNISADNGAEFRIFKSIEELELPRVPKGFSAWQISMIKSFIEKDEELKKNFYSLGPEFCVFSVLSMHEFLCKTTERIKRLGEYNAAFKTQTADFRREYSEFTSIVESLNKSQEAAAISEMPDFSDSIEKILSYGKIEGEEADDFKKLKNNFVSLRDKNEMNDELRELRGNITKLFYRIYKAVFLRSLGDAELPVVIKMFLIFGFVDQELAGKENTKLLYRIAQTIKSDSRGKVLTIYEWLKLIYEGKADPSKNGFEQDYATYLREQKNNGYISESRRNELLTDREGRLSFEIENFFQAANRMTFGRVTTFVPFFYSDTVIKPLEKCLVNPQRVGEAVERLREIDFSCYYREVLDSWPEIGVNKFYRHEEVLPYLILLPNVGSRVALWQEIEGSRRDTPGRMMISIFHTEDLNEAVVKLSGEFRWEMCKRIQGVRWSDVTDPSLTSEYCDYLQFYRKNKDLSPDMREKIKQQLSKARNNYKNAFVLDYMQYILSEARGAVKLNRVARLTATMI